MKNIEGIGKLMVRATVGGYFVGHGLQKITGWFGGDGPDGTGEFFESIGLRPGRETALLTGAAETTGGTLLALGFLTPLGVASVVGVMTNAIRHVHAKNGAWNSNGGVELPVTVIAALAALAESGPGPMSLDAKLGIEAKGAVVTGLALAAGAAAATYVSQRSEELLAKEDADTPIARAMEYVGSED